MSDRRGWIQRMLQGSATLLVGSALPSLVQAHEAPPTPAGMAEDAWLTALAGKKQKTFLDVRAFELGGAPFRRSQAMLTALTDAYGYAANDVGVAFGCHGTALAFVLNEQFWREYGVAEYIAKSMRAEDAAKLRADVGAAIAMCATGVKAVQDKGMHVLACRNTMARWSRDLGAAKNENADAVRDKLLAHLLPKVEPVPAMIGAASVAQTRGFGYIAIE
ncbi:MAG: hypothetical protein LCH84_02615 [Gemmatimonadetes bacterium]|nr:hypothetical protein [Gemmatimonadota bacterium]